MAPWKRFLIGMAGGAVPAIVSLLAVDLAGLIDHWKELTVGMMLGVPLRYIIMMAIGGGVALLYHSETEPMKIVQLGAAAPAILASWINAQPSAANLPSDHRQAQKPVSSISLFVGSALASPQTVIDMPSGEKIILAGFLKDLASTVFQPLRPADDRGP